MDAFERIESLSRTFLVSLIVLVGFSLPQFGLSSALNWAPISGAVSRWIGATHPAEPSSMTAVLKSATATENIANRGKSGSSSRFSLGNWTPTIHGVYESYFLTNRSFRGVVRRGSWDEINVDFKNGLGITASEVLLPTNHFLDERFIRTTLKDGTYLQAGRFRSAFGFGDWTELFYKGFNYVPIIRLFPVTNGISLFRDDTGAQATFNLGSFQFQTAAIDIAPSDEQFIPQRVNHANVRVQTMVGPVIVGGSVFSGFEHEERAFGLDFRYSIPRLIIRSEFIRGNGNTQSAEGFYADATFRVPGLLRTQLLARTEAYRDLSNNRTIALHTLGVRQVINQYFTLNLNYSFGSNPNGFTTAFGPNRGFSAIGLIQFWF